MANVTDKEDFELFLQEVGIESADLDVMAVDELLPKKDWEPWVVGDSDIHGQGMFATVDLEPGCPIAILRVGEDWAESSRWINHSPGCNAYAHKMLDTIMLEVYEPIAMGDEILVDYRDIKDAIEHNGERIFTYDNFCPNPQAVADSARSAGFGAWKPSKGLVGSSVYEGTSFWGNHASMVSSIINHTKQVVIPNTMFFRVTNIGTETAYIHSDRETGKHTCVCYLSEHEDEYGTAFYRHVPTGLLEMPSFEDQRKLGLDKQFAQDMVDRNPDNWEMVEFVQGKFNRAVIFWAPLFHSRIPITGFGDNEDEGRLIWASHFYKLRGSGELC